jgi:hypothetical protein
LVEAIDDHPPTLHRRGAPAKPYDRRVADPLEAMRNNMKAFQVWEQRLES